MAEIEIYVLWFNKYFISTTDWTCRWVGYVIWGEEKNPGRLLGLAWVCGGRLMVSFNKDVKD